MSNDPVFTEDFAITRRLGLHTMVEYVDCDSELLSSAKTIEPIMLEAVSLCGAQYIDHKLQQFEPQGASGIVLIAESHLSFHSWPEYGYLALDIFTCNPSMTPDKGISHIAEAVGAGDTRVRRFDRGY